MHALGDWQPIHDVMIYAEPLEQVGDIINMKGDWALAEWYPNHRPKSKAKDMEAESVKTDAEKATA